MKINSIPNYNLQNKQSFGRIYLTSDAHEVMKCAGSRESEINYVRNLTIKGKDAQMYYEVDEGYYIFTDQKAYFAGTNPSARDVIELVNSINRSR